MKQEGEDNPATCSLSSMEFREREATLLARFKSCVTATEDVSEGYAFRLTGDLQSLSVAAEWIAAERECCRFITFALTAEPNMGPVILRITGPSGTKDLLRTMFCR